ncbi:hypothetical protein PV325_007597 [Microctonus aethiopoides]|nr:hypothetical protein PV325_007597 [Microctonus aethiopoides]
MPAPYDKSKKQLLQSLIENCEEPSPNWPEYDVEIRGRADTYKGAEARVKILRREPYAFTTDNEESAKFQASEDIKLFRIKSTANKRDDLRNKLRMANAKFKNLALSRKKESSSRFIERDNKSNIKEKKFTTKSSESTDESCISEALSTQSLSDNITDSSQTSCSEQTDTDRSKSSKRKKKLPKININKKQKLNDTASSTSSNNSSLHNDLDLKKPSGQLGSSLSDQEIDEPVTTKSTISQDSTQDCVIIKYFKSISKQIGQLNSLLVQNTAELKSLSVDVRDMQRNLKKKCTYDGDDHDDSVDNSGHQDNIEDETQEAGEKIKKFDFPIDAKDNFDDFNIQLNTESNYRKQVVKRMCQIINKSDTINKNMTAIIKAYISRNVATLYVPSKSPMGNQTKPVFKNTHFYECIEGKVFFL